MERLILDTSVLVAAERERANLAALVAEDDDVAIAAITAAELMVGIELADSRHKRPRRQFVSRVLEALPIESYDLEVATEHARLLAFTQKRGRSPGAHDLIIAATAAARDRILVTSDSRGFADLPGVAIRSPS